MRLTLKPVGPDFVAVASGLDLRRPLTAGAITAIEAAMDRFGVLVFHDQPLDEEQQLAFTRGFGRLDIGLKKVFRAPNRFKHEESIDISNVGMDGAVVARDSAKLYSNIANQLWHSDSSFQRPAAKYSVLTAQVVPGRGGETEFADMRAAYDALTEDMKEQLEDLIGEHWALHSRMMLGDTHYTEAQKATIAPVEWPLVREHAGSGRKHLFIGVHVRRILGMTLPEGRMLLLDLLEHATQRKFVHPHIWGVNDLVMWDNRCVLHRGRHFDPAQRRELRRSTVDDLTGADEQAA